MAALSWKQGFVTEGRCQLQYFTHSPGADSGQGEWVLFLHGFGQNYRAFEALADSLCDQCHLLSVNIFFHGESMFEGKAPLQMEEWKAVMHHLFQKLGIEKVKVIGFSMGCKFSLTLAQLLPDHITSLTLIAPDGMVQNPWYRFATQSVFGRFTLRATVSWLPFLRFLTLFFARTGLIRASLGRFVEHQMNTKEKRDQVLNVWLRFRHIWPHWNILPGILSWRQIPVTILLGKFDTIIPVSKFNPKRAEWAGFEWRLLEAGHANLVQKVAEQARPSGI